MIFKGQSAAQWSCFMCTHTHRQTERQMEMRKTTDISAYLWDLPISGHTETYSSPQVQPLLPELLSALMVPIEVQKISALYGTQGVITAFTHAHGDFASWHKQTPVQTPPNYIFKIHLHKCLPSGLILSGPVQIFVHISHSHLCATWPTPITLLELIPLVHNTPNCYNMKNHVNSPDGLWKLPQDWHKMFSFLGYENWQIIKFFCTHMHKTLNILSHTAGNVPSTLCSRILGIPVARECRIFHNLKTFFHTFCGLQMD
jgi:hypothetical protein